MEQASLARRPKERNLCVSLWEKLNFCQLWKVKLSLNLTPSSLWPLNCFHSSFGKEPMWFDKFQSLICILIQPIPVNLAYLFICLMFIYFLRERETECKQGRGRERGSHRIQSRLQALNCQHRALRRARTQELRDHDLTWSQMPNWATQVPCS